jgi:serine/threonine-protein kinase
MTRPSPCPDLVDLKRLALGQIFDPEASVVEEHILGCERCGAAFARLREADTLVEAMRAHPPRFEQGDRDQVEHLIERFKVLGPGSTEVMQHRLSIAATPLPDEITPPPDQTLKGGAPPSWSREPEAMGRFGPYQIVRELGAGGMGVVYEAWQAHPRRLVALKVSLKRFLPGQPYLARFMSESEIIARLQHPSIVQVFEAGEHEGQLYFAMELVPGGNLAQKLAAAPVTARQAAELVRRLAEAMQFAHQRGFIHRDLKPSNILLTLDGAPKVSDFGLAKKFQEGPQNLAQEVQTLSGTVLGTPSYMAPEQTDGNSREVRPAADVYALGAILYECLTGRPPFRAATPLETLEQVRRREPVPPRRLQQELPRDLQTICLKCLEKQPGKRYASAQDLADDLGRFLRGEAIRARPVSSGERLVKWARRQPALAALTALSCVFLVTLLVGGLVYQARLREAVRQAEANADQTRREQQRADAGYKGARDTLNKMLGRLEEARPAQVPALKEMQRALLEDALKFYQGVLQETDHPETRVQLDAAWAYKRAATIQQMLGRLEDSATNYRRSIELVKGLPPEDREGQEPQVLLAVCTHNLGVMASVSGRRDESERLHRETLSIYTRLHQADPRGGMWRSGMASSEHNLGTLYQLNGQRDEAEAHYLQSISLLTGLVQERPQEKSYQAALADSLINLGLIYSSANRRKEAQTSFEKAETLLKPLAREHPEHHALSLAGLYNNWGRHYSAAEQTKAALECHDKAVRLTDEVLDHERTLVGARERGVQVHGVRALFHEHQGRHAEAVADWDRVVELAEAKDVDRYRHHRALALARSGEYRRAVDEASSLARKANAAGDYGYNLACVWALSIEPARTDARLPTSEQAGLAERHALNAMALLRRLQTEGYFKDSQQAEWLGKDPDLKPLHSREDFRRLLSELTRKD